MGPNLFPPFDLARFNGDNARSDLRHATRERQEEERGRTEAQKKDEEKVCTQYSISSLLENEPAKINRMCGRGGER